MKRMHVHIAVENLDKAIGFYSTLFGAEPSVVKDDYAKWMLDDPRVNFAISDHSPVHGVDHLGIQVDSRDELDELAGRLNAAGSQTRDQEATNCCYAKSDKAWVNDPTGLRWETFYTFGEATSYGEDEPVRAVAAAPANLGAACCAPSESKTQPVAACC